MIWRIPSAITDVKASHESYFLIDDDHFLVVAPKLRDSDVRMSVDFDVFMHALEMLLDVLRVVVDKKRGFHKTDDKNLDTPLSYCCQNKIKSICTVLYTSRSFEHEIWSNHPSRDAYLSFSFHQFVVEIFVVTTTITIKFGVAQITLLGITVESILAH